MKVWHTSSLSFFFFSLSSHLDIYSLLIILIMYYVEQCYAFPVSTFIHSKHMQLISPKKICLENQVFIPLIPLTPHQVIFLIIMNRSLLGVLATIRWYLYAIDSSSSLLLLFLSFFFLPLCCFLYLLFVSPSSPSCPPAFLIHVSARREKAEGKG